ncbi:Ig-like domain-containing protein [Pyxidicoccus sp. 3LG]
MHRFPRLVLLVAPLLTAACIDVPEVVDVEPQTDAGSTLPDAGTPSDAGIPPASNFTLTLTPTEDTVLQGSGRTLQVAIVRTGGFNGSVVVTLANPPTGISAQPATIPAGSTSTSLSVEVTTSAAPVPTVLTVRADSGTLSQMTNVTLNVVKLGDLAVRWATPSESTSYVNGALPFEVVVEGGTPDAVELLRDSTLLIRLTEPPYTFTWETTSEAEGEYQLTARAARGASSFTSAARTVVVDRTPPSIVTLTPAVSAANVSVRETPQVTFSESMKSSTVMASNAELSVIGGPALDTALSLSQDGQRLTLTPNTALPVSSAFRVRLGTTSQPLTDLAGNALAPTDAWTFSVPAWLPLGGAISASPGGTSAENVDMKLDGNGQPVIAWSESDGASVNIHVARWDGSSWQPLGSALSGIGGTGTDAANPTLHVDATGQIRVAWDESIGVGQGRNIYARKWNNGSWEDLPGIPLSGDSERLVNHPALAMTQEGTLFMYLSYYDGAISKITGFRLGVGASTWMALGVQSPADHFSSGECAVTAQGANVFSAYNTYLDSMETRGIGVLRNHTQPLGSGLVVSPSDSAARRLAISVNKTGTPLVAWEESLKDGSSGRIYFTQWLGSSWQMPEHISSNATSNSEPSVAIGSADIPIIAWSGVSGSERTIFVSRRSETTWELIGPALNAYTETNTPAFAPSLVLDSTGQPIVAWHENAGSTASIHVYRYNH